MASSIALRRILYAKSLSPAAARSFPPVAASASRRLFNTNVARHSDEDDSDGGLDRRSGNSFRRVPRTLSDVYDPFSSPRSLSQILDQLISPTVSTISGSPRNWDAKETSEGLHLRMDMPGLGKEHVKVTVEQNTLIIKGDSEEENNTGRRYTSRIDLPEKAFRVDQIKAEMKNGVLKVLVPKMKEEERSDVVHVNVD